MAEEVFMEFGDDLTGVPDEKTVPAGEYELRLLKVELKQQKPEKGNGQFLRCLFDIPAEADAKLVNHTLMLPSASDDERTRNNRLRNIRDFHTAFDIPLSGRVNYEEVIGNTGWANIREEESEEYGMQNSIRRFMPRR